MYKDPVQVSRERTALTQYDREGVEIPRFQNSQLSVTRVQVEVKYRKVKRKGYSHQGQIPRKKGRKEGYWV